MLVVSYYWIVTAIESRAAPRSLQSMHSRLSLFPIRGHTISEHAAMGGGGVFKMRADACMGGGGVEALRAHAFWP